MKCGDCLLFSPRTLFAGVCIDGEVPKKDDDEACIDWSPQIEECAWFDRAWCRGKNKPCPSGICPAWDHLYLEYEPMQEREP